MVLPDQLDYSNDVVAAPVADGSSHWVAQEDVPYSADSDSNELLFAANGTQNGSDPDAAYPPDDIRVVLPHVLKSGTLILIILLAIFSNLLVVLSVFRYHKLRHINNYFLVSLAFADLLVACFAMTFNATVVITGTWNFGYRICDLWNSLDVHFSTVSTLHLCCISVDRYYAIVKPLKYTSHMTVKVASVMIGVAWTAPTLISFLPIFLGWYTTADHQEWREHHPNECIFKVNKPYAILSSTLTFWAPVIVMLFMYHRIYKEALRQKEAIRRSSVPSQQHFIIDSNQVRNPFPALPQLNGVRSSRNGNSSSSAAAAASVMMMRPPPPPIPVVIPPAADPPGTAGTAGIACAASDDAALETTPLRHDECETEFGRDTVTKSSSPARLLMPPPPPAALLVDRKTSMAHSSTGSEELPADRSAFSLLGAVAPLFGAGLAGEAVNPPGAAAAGRPAAAAPTPAGPGGGLAAAGAQAQPSTLPVPVQGATSVMGVWTLGLGLLGDKPVGEASFLNPSFSETPPTPPRSCSATPPSTTTSTLKLSLSPPPATKQVRLLAVPGQEQPDLAASVQQQQQHQHQPGAGSSTSSSPTTTAAPATYDQLSTHVEIFNQRRMAQRPSMVCVLSAQTTSWLRERHRMHTSWRKEHKAFVTLGIVMGAFLLCWMPFFTWYLTVTICDDCYCPDIVVSILFWIGYFNSTLNPVIYVMTNRDFKDAFTDILRKIFCFCCLHRFYGGAGGGAAARDHWNHSNVDYV